MTPKEENRDYETNKFRPHVKKEQRAYRILQPLQAQTANRMTATVNGFLKKLRP